jgi:hypothetical protein
VAAMRFRICLMLNIPRGFLFLEPIQGSRIE